MTTTTLTRSTSRGTCKRCGRSEKLRLDGRLCKHPVAHHGTIICAGTGKKPRSNTTKTKAKKRVAAAVATKTHVAVLLDRSTSMYGLRHGAVKAFNALCEPIRSQGGSWSASYYTFGSDITPVWLNVGTGCIPVLTESSYTIYGATALYDAIARAITDQQARDDGKTSFLVIVITDGEENQSRTGAHDLADRIKRVQATDRWTIAISCPKGYGERLQRLLGLPAGNFQEWEQTDAGMLEVEEKTSGGVVRYAALRASGQTRSTTFHATVDVGALKVKAVKRAMTKLDKRQYRLLKTTAECQIRPFVENKGLAFVAGCAYYKLNKPETVQERKKLILRRRKTGELFGGTGAREVCGLPLNKRGRVTPGNLGEWDVFVQSTSVNRKLLGRMEVLYDKTLA